LKFGLAVSGRGNLKVLEKMALKADEVGYDSFLVTDHFLLSGSNDHIDVWSFLPYLAGKTDRIRLGTCVTPLPFRQPAILAKSIACCDVLSNGRIILGAGFGWYRPEFEAFSKWLETGDRIAYSREALELMLRLWHEKQPFDFHGRFIEAKGVVVEPRPVQVPHPPILWGGHQPASLRTAARYADGWMPIGPRWFGDEYPRPEEYAAMKRTIMGEMKRLGRPSSRFVFTNLINMAETKTLKADIEQYVQSGINYFTLGDKAKDEDSVRNIARVASDIGGSL
jgi:alkanesulfonate monooxygenase SsuD/methylene tetrahydromethanopterin reductase-like flavin-dependent oxidoreductase (luciferase family)